MGQFKLLLMTLHPQCVYVCESSDVFHGASQQRLTQLEQDSLKSTQLAAALGKPLVISERQSLPRSDALCCKKISKFYFDVWECGKEGREHEHSPTPLKAQLVTV